MTGEFWVYPCPSVLLFSVLFVSWAVFRMYRVGVLG